MSLIAAAIAVCAWAAPTQAATVTVGSTVLPTGNGYLGNNGSDVTVANTGLAEAGAHVTSPASGTIVQWRVITLGTGRYAIRVLRPASEGQYTAVGTSAQTVTVSGLNTFTANLPIQAGDLIGLDLPNLNGVEGQTPLTGATWVNFFDSLLADGATAAPNPIGTENGAELAFNADVEYTPPATPVPHKKRCKKKKHKRSAESAKKKKCKKRKRR